METARPGLDPDLAREPRPDGARGRKFRQAAFVYLHVGILYLAAVWAMAGAGVLPEERGPVGVWLAFGAVILAVVFWGLWSWQNAWFARVIWALHALRLPALVEGAFFPAGEAALPSSFYLTAMGVVLVNLWMLARAGWDL
jgi:hypothetical protein